MSSEIVPAIVAAGGGMALAGGVYLHERRRAEELRASRIPVGLRFPSGLTAGAVQAGLSELAGLPSEVELVTEVAACRQGITHRLWVPRRSRSTVVAALQGAIPSLRLLEATPVEGGATFAVRLFVTTPAVLRGGDVEASSRAILLNLTELREDEAVCVRWALRPSFAPTRGVETGTQRETPPMLREWRRKAALPGFRVAGLVLVRADRVHRARSLAEGAVDALRNRVLLGAIRPTSERGTRTFASMPRAARTNGWLSVEELVPLLGYPLGASGAVPGLEVGVARELPVPRGIPSRGGRRLFVGRGTNGSERPVALTPEAARHHMAVVGPSGTGKSALLARGVLEDLEHGHGGVLIDPKQDLLDAVLDRVPRRHRDRVVVLDPASPSPVPGLDVLGAGDPDLRADVLVGALRSVTPDWGIRSEIYARMALRTLAEIPGATLADLPRLFAEPALRAQAVGHIADPLLAASWQAYDALSPAERAQHIQAPMARLTALIGRPAVRAVLAQPEPKLDVGRLFAERTWLLATLSPGALGEPASRLLGSVLMYVVWSAIERRVSLPPEQRHPVFLYIDELATLSGLPFGFELLAERGRGLGSGLVVAAQGLARVPESIPAALLGNVGTLVSFRAPSQEAVRLARELPGLKRLWISDGEIVGATLTPAYAAVAAWKPGFGQPRPCPAAEPAAPQEAPTAAVGGESTNPGPRLLRGQGLHFVQMVETVGIEPTSAIA